VKLRTTIGYLQKLLYTVNRIRMSPMPTLNIYLFESPIFGMNAIDIFSFRYFFTVFPLVFYVAQLNNSSEYNLEPIHER
jgi:hypothetical protein